MISNKEADLKAKEIAAKTRVLARFIWKMLNDMEENPSPDSVLRLSQEMLTEIESHVKTIMDERQLLASTSQYNIWPNQPEPTLIGKYIIKKPD
ncbi:hypothetical protein QQ054_00950 [Oscillatoria amoena NRMC-F 0135]|nr:hypothetical protein [Oscillatoria amoena NRMC-F 0135]